MPAAAASLLAGLVDGSCGSCRGSSGSPSSPALTSRERALLDSIDDHFRTALIERRNRRMAARVIDLLVNRPDTYFFAFGAGHFVGKDSILEFVESAGFKVEKIVPGETLDFR